MQPSQIQMYINIIGLSGTVLLFSILSFTFIRRYITRNAFLIRGFKRDEGISLYNNNKKRIKKSIRKTLSARKVTPPELDERPIDNRSWVNSKVSYKKIILQSHFYVEFMAQKVNKNLRRGCNQTVEEYVKKLMFFMENYEKKRLKLMSIKFDKKPWESYCDKYNKARFSGRRVFEHDFFSFLKVFQEVVSYLDVVSRRKNRKRINHYSY